ncbi:MAG: hypothetical protein ACRDUS_17145 [Mycobacterium sp.]
MDGEPDPTSSGPGPGGSIPDDPNAAWRRPDAAAPVPEPHAVVPEKPAPRNNFLSRRILEFRAMLAGLTINQMWQTVVVVVVFATAGFGGLDTVTPPAKTFTSDEKHDTGELNMVVKRASLIPEITLGSHVVYKLQPGRKYLGVVASLTNNGTIPVTFGVIGGVMPMVPIGIPYQVPFPAPPIRISDATRAAIQPGLTEDVALVWSVPDTAVAVGDEVTFRTPDREYGSYTVGYGDGWMNAATYADITLTIGAPK